MPWSSLGLSVWQVEACQPVLVLNLWVTFLSVLSSRLEMIFKKASRSLSNRDGLDAASEWAEGCGVQLLFYLNFLGITNPRDMEEPAKYHKNIYEWTHLGQNEMDNILSCIVIKISNVLLESLTKKTTIVQIPETELMEWQFSRSCASSSNVPHTLQWQE